MAERVLLAEDSRTQAEELRFLLAASEYDVTIARTGEDALRLMQTAGPFDVLLSDIVMPGMSGYDLCRKVKAEFGRGGPPVILLTTLTDPTDIVRGLECGADNYVTKPYDPALLLQRIGQVLENRRLRPLVPAEGPVEVQFLGNSFSIASDKEQILDMLLSSFEELVRASEALQRSKRQLAVLHGEAEDRADRLTRLQEITEALSLTRTPTEVLEVVVNTARAVLGGTAGLAALATAAGDALETVQAEGHADGHAARGAAIPLGLPLPITDAVRTGEIVVVPSRAAFIERYGEVGAGPYEAVIAAPFMAEGRTLGAWAISFAHPRSFDEVDRQFFLTLTHQCAQALDRARLFEAEQRARAEAEEANRVKAQFLASMSHDLRTPLNAIGGYVELIDLGIRGPVTDAQRADLKRIKRSQEFLLSLINDVLNFAKLEAGAVLYDLVRVRLRPVLLDLEGMIKPQMASKGLRYGWSIVDEGVAVICDQEKLQQVLLNLVGNALKFTPEGGFVEVGCEVAGDWVRVSVADSGIGIPPEKIASVFDPFVQVNQHDEAAGGGIGLGLAISRELMRGMSGELTVVTEPGVGSTFTLTLPRGPDLLDAAPPGS